MKKLVLVILCLVILILPVMGCVSVNIGGAGTVGISGPRTGVHGKGNLETFTFNVNEIKELRISILCNIEYSTTFSDTITLEIQPNLMDYVTVEESGGVLTIRSTRNINWGSGTHTPVLMIGSSLLTKVVLAGAGTFTAHDTITVDTFNIDFAGAGSGKADFDVNNLIVNLAGAADLAITGITNGADFTLAGAGRIDALDLQTRVANINLAGAGTVRVSCSDSLTVSAAGVGTVEYRGSPSVDITRGGLVSVRQVN